MEPFMMIMILAPFVCVANLIVQFMTADKKDKEYTNLQKEKLRLEIAKLQSSSDDDED